MQNKLRQSLTKRKDLEPYLFLGHLCQACDAAFQYWGWAAPEPGSTLDCMKDDDVGVVRGFERNEPIISIRDFA